MITPEANETGAMTTVSLLVWQSKHEIDDWSAGGEVGLVIHVHTIYLR